MKPTPRRAEPKPEPVYTPKLDSGDDSSDSMFGDADTARHTERGRAKSVGYAVTARDERLASDLSDTRGAKATTRRKRGQPSSPSANRSSRSQSQSAADGERKIMMDIRQNPMDYQAVVSSAGTKLVNGFYSYNKGKFWSLDSLGGDEVVIWTESGKWHIGLKEDRGITYYENPRRTPIPPRSGWMLGLNADGQLPCPTISYQKFDNWW